MPNPQNILIFAEDDVGVESVQRLADLAVSFGARLTIAAVVPPAREQVLLSRPSLDLADVEQLMIEDCRRRLADLVSRIDSPGLDLGIEVLVGKPVPALLEFVEREGVDLLVKEPSPNEGLRSSLLGGLDLRLLRTVPCTVAIGTPRPVDGVLRFVAAVDYDVEHPIKAGLNRRILDSARSMLTTESVEVYVVHAWALYGHSILATGRGQVPPERLREAVENEEMKRREWLRALVEDYRASLSSDEAGRFRPTVVLVHGEARVAIPRKIKELGARAVSLGTCSRTGLKGMVIGNTAEQILQRVADCTVVVHKPDGFVPPLGRA